MSESEESNESEAESEAEVLVEQHPQIKVKKCFVRLERLNLAITNLDAFDSDSSSDDDLPGLPFLFSSQSSKPKPKSTKELMEEHENLTKAIKVDSIYHYNFEEKLKDLEVVEYHEVKDMSLSPPPTVNEEKNINILCVNDVLQFFNSGDLTLLECGYDSNSTDLTAFEIAMLSFKRVELEHVLSSFLFSSNICCISDCKSFVTFLLRNLSVHSDISCVQACYKTLCTILDKHPSAKGLEFSSAEIFMLLFNYGIDIDSFKFLSKRPDIQRYLEEPKFKNKGYSKIPENWIFNFKITLNAVINLIKICEFNINDLCNIIIYFMWMSLDSSLLSKNILSTVRKCICVALNRVPAKKWPTVMREVAWTFMSMEFLSVKEKWSNVYHITNSVPVTSEKGLELRKYISFLALTWLGKVELAEESSKEKIIAEINKAPNRFNLVELQSILESLVYMDSDLVSFATKFLDICISNLKGMKDEDFKELCNILKQHEIALMAQSHEAKAHTLKIYSKLKIRLGKDVMYKTQATSEDHNKIKYITVKEEVDVNIEDVPNPFHFAKVKTEPVQEPVAFVMNHGAEKIISFSEFNCENELDFDSFDKSLNINMNVVHDIVKTERTTNSDFSNFNDVNSLNMPSLFAYSSCDISEDDCMDSPEFPGDVTGENISDSDENLISNPSELNAVFPLNLVNNFTPLVEINQNSDIDNCGIKETLVNCELKTCGDTLRQTSECMSGLVEDSYLSNKFVNSDTNFSHSYEIEHSVECETVVNSKCRFNSDSLHKDLFIDKTTASFVDVSVDKSPVLHIDVLVENPNLLSDKSVLSVDKPESDTAGKCCVDKEELKALSQNCERNGEEKEYCATVPASSDNSVEPVLSDQHLNNESKLPLEDSILNKKSILFETLMSNIETTCTEANQSEPVELHDIQKSSSSCDLYNASDNVSNIQSDLTHEFMNEKCKKIKCATVPASSDNNVEPVLSDQHLNNESKLSLEDNILNKKSILFETLMSNIETTCTEANQSEPVELHDIYKSSSPCDLYNAADNVSNIQSDYTHEFMNKKNHSNSELITVEGLKDRSLADNFDRAEQNNCLPSSEFNSESENCSDTLSKLFESLVLSKGIEISDVNTSIVSTVGKESLEPPVHNSDVNVSNIRETVIDEEIVFIEEMIPPQKSKKRQDKKPNYIVEIIDSDDSDKELEIVFFKPAKSSKSNINSSNCQDKSKISETIDEDVMFVSEVMSNVNKTKPNLIGSKSLESKDITNNKVCNGSTVVNSKKITLPPKKDFKKSLETEASKLTDIVENSDISNDDGIVFISHIDLSSKNKSCTSQCNETVIKNDEIISNEAVLPTPNKSENITSNDSDVNLCKDNLTLDSIMPSMENSNITENEQTFNHNSDILPECVVTKYTEIVIATMNEVIPMEITYPESKVIEQQSGKSSCSVDTGILIENGNMQKEDSVKNSKSVLRATLDDNDKDMSRDIRDKLHLKTDNKTGTGKKTLNKVGTKCYPKRKVKLLKRKSTLDSVKNELSDFTKKEEVRDSDVINVLNDLLTSVIILNKNDVDSSVYNVPNYTKSSNKNASLSDQFISTSSYMPEESNLESVESLQEGIQELGSQAEKSLMVKCPQSSKIKPLRKDSKIENMKQCKILHNSNNKNLTNTNGSLELDKKNDIQPKCKMTIQTLQSVSKSNIHSPQKRKNVEFSSPSSKTQKHSMNSVTESGANGFSNHSNFNKHMPSASPSTFSPKKSFFSTKKLSNKKSSNKYFNYNQKRTNYCAFKHSKKAKILSNIGLNLGNILKERLESPSNQLKQNSLKSSNTKICMSSDNDFDVQELYLDPKRYADKECVIVFESEEQIVLDSD